MLTGELFTVYCEYSGENNCKILRYDFIDLPADHRAPWVLIVYWKL